MINVNFAKNKINLNTTSFNGLRDSKSNKNDDRLNNFTTFYYTNKSDNKEYVAKKLTLVQGGKNTTGILVHEKDTKADIDGNIQGQFMSYDAFIDKLNSELPTLTSSQIKSYAPNIEEISLEDKFDKSLKNAIKLSDGQILLRPIVVNTGFTELKPSKMNGYYDVVFTSFVGGFKHAPVTKTITEQELLKDKTLCAGTLLQRDNDYFEVKYYKGTRTNDYTVATELMNKKTCEKFMKAKGYFI